MLRLAALVALLALPTALAAQDDEKELGWFDTAELSLVQTGGNSESTTFGFKNELRHEWERATFRSVIGGLRTETTRITIRAIGTSPDDVRIVEEEDRETTAERYQARARYDRQVHDRAFLFGGAGWERNTFAGFENRTNAVVGAGLTWFDREGARFKTDLGVTVTHQDDVDDDLTTDDTFAGLRLSYEYMRQVTGNSTFTSELVVDENLNATEDLRADFTNAISVSMSERMALKAAHQVLYDNEPSKSDVELFSPAGNPVGSTVLVPLEEVDTELTIALVIDF